MPTSIRACSADVRPGSRQLQVISDIVTGANPVRDAVTAWDRRRWPQVESPSSGRRREGPGRGNGAVIVKPCLRRRRPAGTRRGRPGRRAPDSKEGGQEKDRIIGCAFPFGRRLYGVRENQRKVSSRALPSRKKPPGPVSSPSVVLPCRHDGEAVDHQVAGSASKDDDRRGPHERSHPQMAMIPRDACAGTSATPWPTAKTSFGH
jgi:hypothetical protein